MKRPLAGIVVAYASGIWIGSWLAWPLMTLLLLPVWAEVWPITLRPALPVATSEALLPSRFIIA